MSASPLALACVCLLAGSGCIGTPARPGGDGPRDEPAADGGPPASSALELFESDVQPILNEACGVCHDSSLPGDGPDFLGKGPSYHDAVLSARAVGGGPLVGDSADNS